MHFNGKGDYLYVPDSPSLWLGPTFTVEMWIKPEFPKEELENWPSWGLMSKGCYIGTGKVKTRGFGVTLHRFNDDPNLLMIDYNTADDNGIYGKSYGRRDFDNWMHLYHVFSPDRYKPGHGYPLVVGKFLIPESPFAGQIGEIRIWRGARSREQISEYRNKPLTGDEPDLVACWTFEQAGGQIAYDISTNRNHARLGTTTDADEADPKWIDIKATSDLLSQQTDVQVEVEPVEQKEQAADSAISSNYAWQRTDRYVAPDPDGFFPDDPEAGKRLDALFNAVDRDRGPVEEVLSTVRQGFRRTTRHRTLILGWIGGKYVWKTQSQNPQAIEIMYHAVPMGRHYAVYFGLSVVQPKTPNILRTLAEICMQGEDVGRITWGIRSQREELVSYIKPYLQDEDTKKREIASMLLKHFNGEIDFEKWKREKLLEQKTDVQVEGKERGKKNESKWISHSAETNKSPGAERQIVIEARVFSIKTPNTSIPDYLYSKLGIKNVNTETALMMPVQLTNEQADEFEKWASAIPGTTTLVSPKVTAVNGELVDLSLTTQHELIMSYKKPEDSSGKPEPVFEKFTTGVKLGITPELQRDGKAIVLKLAFSKNDLVRVKKGLNESGYEIELPVLNTVAVNTNVIVASGKNTLVPVAGLFSTGKIEAGGKPIQQILLLVKTTILNLASGLQDKPDVQVEGEVRRRSTVEGQVLGPDGRPVKDARILLGGISPRNFGGAPVSKIRTDENGQFAITDIDKRATHLLVWTPRLDLWKARLPKYGHKLQINLPEPATLTIRYDIEGADKEGTFRLELETWKMEGWKGLATCVRNVNVLNKGEITLTGLTPGLYDLARTKTLRGHGLGKGVFCDRKLGFAIDAGSTTVVDFIRKEGCPITGYLTGLPDSRLKGAFVYVKSAEATGDPRKFVDDAEWKLTTFDAVVTDGKGNFTTAMVSPGAYMVVAESYEEMKNYERRGIQLPDFVGTAKVIVPEKGEVSPVEIKMKSYDYSKEKKKPIEKPDVQVEVEKPQSLIFHGLDLTAVPHTTNSSKLPDLFEARPPGSKSYHIQKDVTAIYSGLDGTVYFIPRRNIFYVQHDKLGSSTLTYYGPFEGNPVQVLNLQPDGQVGFVSVLSEATGRVVDVNGQGVSGATLKFYKWDGTEKKSRKIATTMSDKTGRFHIPVIRTGEHLSVWISAPGFAKRSVAFVYPATDGPYSDGTYSTDNLIFKLKRLGIIEGQVIGPNGNSLVWAPLSLSTTVQYPNSGEWTSNHLRAITDEQGHFRMEDVPPGTHLLYYPWRGPSKGEVSSGRWRAFHGPDERWPSTPAKGVCAAKVIKLGDGQELRGIVIDLSKSTCAVEGQVHDTHGRVVADAMVSLYWVQSSGWSSVNGKGYPPVATDAEGRYRLQNLPPGDWHIKTWHDQVKQQSKPVPIELKPGRTIQQDLALSGQPELDAPRTDVQVEVEGR